MLLEEFLNPLGLTQRELADGIRVPYQRVNEIVNKRRGMTPGTALRLSKFLGTSADFWMSLLAAVRNGVIPAIRKGGFLPRRGSAADVGIGEVGDVAGM
jgi:addiction module HigA family antidote